MTNIAGIKTSLLQKTINQSCVDNDRPPINWEKAIYALDKDLNYSISTIKLKNSNVIHKDEIEYLLLELFKDGPDWIHTHIISTCFDFVLITFDVGEKIGNPKPSINISYEINRKVEITEG